MDGDGDIDIVTAGKTGVHFFENLTINHVPKAQREKEILLDTNWPFPGEGPQVKQEEEPKKSERGSTKQTRRFCGAGLLTAVDVVLRPAHANSPLS